MTEAEKIEKLLDHLEKVGELFDCDTHFANEFLWCTDNYGENWCAKHCEWDRPHKECYRYFLLGDNKMGNEDEKYHEYIEAEAQFDSMWGDQS